MATPQRDVTKNTRFALIALRCRDEWRASVLPSERRNTNFSAFAKWALNVHRTEPTQTPLAVQDLLKLVAEPDDYRAYAEADLKSKLEANTNGRSYRIAAGLDIRPGEDDQRVRSLFEFIVKENIPFFTSALICSFFTDTGSANTSGKTKHWPTSLSTRFQQLLYVAAIAKLTAVKNARLEKKRRLNTSLAQYPSQIQGFTNLRDPIPQRIGYAIQKIVEGWDALAISLGFEDLEHIVLPYCRLTTPLVQFQVIQSHGDGFVPASQASDFQADVALTTLRAETFEEAFDRPSNVDKSLRILANDFFKDIDQVLSSSNLYTMADDEKWDFLHSFEVIGARALPFRFRRYSISVCDTIRQYMGKVIIAEIVPETAASQQTTAFTTRMPETEETTAIANRDTDISVSGGALEAARISHDKYEVLKIRDNVWIPPPGLPPYQRLPPHLLSYLASTWQDPKFFTRCSKLAMHQWPRTFQELLQQVDVDLLRLVDATHSGLILSKSKIRHPRAGMGVFAAKTFLKGDRIAAYFGTLVYQNMNKKQGPRKTYGEGVMEVDYNKFKRYAIQVETHGNCFEEVNGNLDDEKSVFVVPAPFCIAAFVTDLDPRIANVRYIESGSSSVLSPGSLLSYDLLIVEAMQLISPGEELHAFCERGLGIHEES